MTMLCSRCGADVAAEATYCARCGTPVTGSAGSGSMQHRREAAVAAFETGGDPARVQCPNCGAYRMHAVRIDADANMALGAMALVLGVAGLVLVVAFGDVGFYVANASAISVVLAIVGVVLLLVARYRRRPKAFDCFACGYRVP